MKNAILGVLMLLGVAHAGEPPPSYLALPPGYTIEPKVQYWRYDFMELSAPDPKDPRVFVHIEPRGRHWWVSTKGQPKNATPLDFGPPLEAAGWQVSHQGATTVAHYTRDGHDTWLKATTGYQVEVLDAAEPARVELTAPGAVPEEQIADRDLPYFAGFPGFHLGKWARHDEGPGCRVRNGVLKEMDLVGPPWIELRYDGPKEVTGVELQESYVAALERAGWSVLATGRGNNTVAHFAAGGRDVWLGFSPMPGYLSVCAADVGAAAASAALAHRLDADGHVALYGIYFDLDRATLRPEAEATLRQLQSLLEKSPTLRVEIQGHTDNAGAHEHNQKLSEARAESVRGWLVAHHIAAARLGAAGYAETRPVAPNANPEGRQKNRRVEIAKLR
jgi:outer membrane protein OmpA-like peptidoglycan-associated protein